MPAQPLPSSALRSELANLRRQTAALQRRIADGVFASHVPVLTASVNPDIGDAGSASGAWARFGNLVFYSGSIAFAGAGVAAGAGGYLISLPTPVSDQVLNGTGVLGGHWRCTGGGLFTNNEIIAFASASDMRCRYSDAHPFGVETTVGAAAPWVWAAGYRIEWDCWYIAAPY